MKKILALLLAGLTAASMAAVVSAADAEAGVDYIECAGGVKVWEWVEGYANEEPDKLFDYDETTKWCHGSSWSYVIWEMPNAVEITGYQMITANDNATYTGRNPDDWILYGCNDYDWTTQEGSWEVIQEVVDDEILQDTNYTPYVIELDKKAPAYKYYQLEITEIEGGATFQLSGFNLLFEGQAAQEVKSEEEILAEKAAAEAEANAAHLEELIAGGYVPAKTLAKVEGITLISGTPGFSDTEGPASLIDYDVNTKWCTNTTHSEGNPWEAIFEMPNAVAITGYQLVTANDTANNEGRNPEDWTLYGSADGSNWTAIDSKTADTTLLAENFLAFDFMLDKTAPEYKFFKFEVTKCGEGYDLIQIADINLIFDGAEAVVEEVVEEPVVEEVVETPVVEEPVVEEVVETPVVEEVVVETPVVDAPQTFDAAIIAAVAAVVSLAGYAISKKR